MVYEEKLLSKGQSAKNLLGYCSFSLCDNNFTTHSATMIRFQVSVSFPVIHVTSVLLNPFLSKQTPNMATCGQNDSNYLFHPAQLPWLHLCSFTKFLKCSESENTSHVWVWRHVLVRYQRAAEQKHACPSKKGLPEASPQPLGALFDRLELPIHNSWQNTWELECKAFVLLSICTVFFLK